MDIQEATADDSEAIVGLFKRYRFALQSREWFDWKYDANPAGNSLRFKVLSGGTIVGAVAMVPQRFTWRDREIIGLQAVDGLLGKELRGKGNFSRLMQFLAVQQPAQMSGDSFHLSFPSIAASMRAHESAGWDRLCSFSMVQCLLTPRQLLEKADVAIMRRALNVPWAAYRKWIMGPDTNAVQVLRWDGSNADFHSLVDVERISGARSSPFMKWRVGDNPRDDIQVLMLYDREVWEGYAVVSITGRTASIVELRLRNPQRRHIQALVRYIYTHHESDAIAFWSLGRSRLDALIRGMGFIRRRLSGDCFVQHLQRVGLPADPAQWDLTYLDSDW